jgi:uracil-DNA glycosylase family 4
MADLLSDLRQFFLRERELFGETLLIDTQPRGGAAVPARKHTDPAAADPGLFELPPAALTSEPWGDAASLDDFNAAICTCMKCPLGATRTKFVFGVGNPRATLMLIGEAPGADEDAQGEPFVGRAGQLLNKILEAIRFKREEVYICNILKCRPPGNRKPAPEEVEQCIPYLRKQIALIRPKLILCLGLTAAENLLQTKEGLGKLRGRILQYEGIPLMVTYHPAALLRNPNWKRPAWEDVQAARKLHDELVAKGE